MVEILTTHYATVHSVRPFISHDSFLRRHFKIAFVALPRDAAARRTSMEDGARSRRVAPRGSAAEAEWDVDERTRSIFVMETARIDMLSALRGAKADWQEIGALLLRSILLFPASF